MSSSPHTPDLNPAPALPAGTGFLLTALTLAAVAAFLAGSVPIAFSMATVFLFAGPHNWLETRYFLARMPARWGKLTGYFTFSFVGILVLCAAFWGIYYVVSYGLVSFETFYFALAVWNSALLLWIATMVHLRSRINPRRDWGWIWPLCLLLIAINWQMPLAINVALVYIHPLMAFWLLNRELRRSRPEWLPAFYGFLATVPLFVGLLWWQLSAAPPLPTSTALETAIVHHAGSDLLDVVSSHFLVATHTFLEMLHYAVWVVAIPLVGFGLAPFQIDTMPLARNGINWRRGILLTLLAGVGIVLVLWACFVVDYTTTRNLYFTIALLHVLAEVPFLLRAL